MKMGFKLLMVKCFHIYFFKLFIIFNYLFFSQKGCDHRVKP